MVGVVVGVEHVCDLEVLGLGELEVDVDVPAGVDNDGLAATGDEVRRTAEVAVEDLAEEQVGALSRLNRTDSV
jgi:hypothetical protein